MQLSNIYPGSIRKKRRRIMPSAIPIAIALGWQVFCGCASPPGARVHSTNASLVQRQEFRGRDDRARERESGVYDWVFFYYMAYDNDLESCGRPILDLLQRGITNDRVAVVTFADFRDTKGMRRYEQTIAGERQTALETEDSAEESTLAAQLTWTRQNYRARHYAVVFLDHGNRLDEMSHDENPGRSDGRTWLRLLQVAPILEQFRAAASNTVELVFIQQCGKGAIENYYALRHTAPFIMASQTTVGAPNDYYAETIKAVCARPDIDGRELAKLIADHEADNMFTTYTTLNEKALNQLPAKLDAVLHPLLGVKQLKRPVMLPERSWAGNPVEAPGQPWVRLCFQPATDEQFCDGLAWLKAMYDANRLDLAPWKNFAKWINAELVSIHRCSPRQMTHAGGWSGFSIYVPADTGALKRYLGYPIYGDTQLDELMTRLLDPEVRPRDQ